MNNQVALIFDETISERVKAAIKGMPIWIIETEGNSPFVAQSRRQPSNAVSTFPYIKSELKTDLTRRIINSLDDHHNECSQDEPYDTLLVFGLTLAEMKTEAFINRGFSKFEETDSGFIARK